jgi:hypothetical protein
MSEQQSSADSDLLNRLRIFVKSESTDWFNLGTRKLEFTQVTAAGNLVQEVIDFLTVRAEPQTAMTSDKIENMLDRIVEAAVYYEQAEGIYNRPAKTELQEAKAAVREVLARHCQAGIEQRHMAQLLTVLDVMKSAHNKEPGRLMSIWSRDIEAVEAAVAALTRPVCTCGGDPDQPAAQHDLTCPATLTSHQRSQGE